MDLWHWHLLLFVLVMTCSGFTQSCIGFGFACVAMSLLPYFMDVRLGNLAVSFTTIPPIVFALWAYRRQLEWSTLGWSLAGASLLLPVGLLAFAFLPADWLVRGTGVAILLIALQKPEVRQTPPSRTTRRLGSSGAGAVSGFLAGAVGIGGPPIAAYAIRQPWSPARYKAFVLAFLLIESVAKAIGVVMAGWVDQTVLWYTVVAIPFAIVGGRLGIAAADRLDPVRFRRAVAAMLIVASVGMIFRGNGQNQSEHVKAAPSPRQSRSPETNALLHPARQGFARSSRF